MSNFEPSLSEEELAPAADTNEPSAVVNTPSEKELLSRAKSAVNTGEQSMRDAAEALGIAQELHDTSQAEMARAVGKSEAWISQLLRWRLSGYKSDSPFGPTTKAGRLKHAKDRAATGASKPRKPRKGSEERQTSADDPQTSTDRRKAENARLFEDELETATSAPGENPADGQDINSPHSAGAQASTSRKPSPAQAKSKLKYAIDHWWPHLDDAGKSEITKYFLRKAGVRAS
jgi:hypothetical protein